MYYDIKLHPLKLFLYGFLSLYVLSVQAQTKEERLEIIKDYNIEKLRGLADYHSSKYKSNKIAAIEYALANNFAIEMYYDDGSYAELQGITPDSSLIYYKTNNVDAAISTRANYLNTGGGLGLSVDGQNMTAYVWDGGHVRTTHQEFDGPGGTDRVSVADIVSEGGLQLSNHGTHVTGIICAAGLLSGGATKGMAPYANALSYRWNDDLSEAILAATNGMLVSNHSYSLNPVSLPDYFFGGYTTGSREWDEVLYNAPFYLMVVSAGNLGNVSHNDTPLNPSFPEYDKLTDQGTSKNNLVVANAQDANIDANGDLVSVAINTGSSQGPTDDLRIKPDITGNGTALLSPIATSDDALATFSGTSMSSPNVAGTLLLLQQYHNELYNTFMRASTLKGLALHTADDAGITGPDANFGWGLLNAKKAAETLSGKGTSSIVEEIVLSQGETYTVTVESDNVNDLWASISWTDPAGVATTNLNDPTPVLVNDLDIKITQNTDEYYPWRLTGVNANASDAENLVDNFERVDVNNASGLYTITVTHKGTLTDNQQYFSLIVTGITNSPTFCSIPQNPKVDNSSSSSVEVSWNASPSNPLNGYDYVYVTDNSVPDENTIPTGSVGFGITSVSLTGLSLNTSYDFYVRANCGGSSATSDWSELLTFVTPCSGTSLPYLEDFEGGNLQSTCFVYTDENLLQVASNCGSNSTNFLQIFGGIHTIETREVDASAESIIEVSFDIYNGCSNVAESFENLRVEYWDGNTWQLIEEVNPSDLSSSWVSKNYFINSGLTSEFKLRYKRQGGSASFDDLNIDNLIIKEPDICSKPIDLNISNITETTADLSWQFSTTSPSDGYEYYVTSSSIQPDNTTVPTGSVGAGITNVTLNSLNASTLYYAYVRANCGVDGMSDWSSAEIFYTLPQNDQACNAITLTVETSSLGDQFLLTNATAELLEPDANLNNGIDGSVWFKFVAPSTGNVRITTDIVGGTADDTEIALYTVTDCNDFSTYTQIGFDQDDGWIVGSGWMSVLDILGLNPGQTYYIQVDRWENSVAGSFGIEVLNLSYTYSNADGYLPYSPISKDLRAFEGDLIGGTLEIFDGTAPVDIITGLANVIVNPSAVLDLNADLVSDIIFKSDNSGSGQLEDATNGNITGIVTVERYIPASNRAFRFLASPVTTSSSIRENWQQSGLNPGDIGFETGLGTHITGSGGSSNGFDTTATNNPSLFVFDNTNQNGGTQDDDWMAISNTDAQIIESRKPYLLFVRGDRTIDLSANPVSAQNQTTLIAKGAIFKGSDNSQILNQDNNAYSLVANPYQAIVNFDNVSKTNLRQDIIVFDPTVPPFGQYETIVSNRFIKPGQSFYVQNDSDVTDTPGGATIIFNENDKTVNGSSSVSVFSEGILSLNLGLYSQNNIRLDVLKLRFQDGWSNNLDDNDTGKIFNQAENLSSINSNTNLSVERRAIPQNDDTIPLDIIQYQNTAYDLRIEEENWNSDIEIYILDKYLNTLNQITASSSYSFSVDLSIPQSIASDRFQIIFDNTTLNVADVDYDKGFMLFPNPTKNGVFTINSNTLNLTENQLNIYNILGQEVGYKSLKRNSNNSYQVDASHLSSGLYLIKINQDQKIFLQKLIIE